MKNLGILSVFLTVDGEANFHSPGVWSVFVRTRGCTVGCHWCDTKYSWQQAGGEEFTPEELLRVVKTVGGKVKKVTITGGEPLEQDWKSLAQFIRILIRSGYSITVETSGTQDTLKFRRHLVHFAYLDLDPRQLSFVVDYKLRTSGFKGHMELHHFVHLPAGDVIKFVIDNEVDLYEASSVAFKLSQYVNFSAGMYFSPSHGNMDPQMLVRQMRVYGLPDINVGINMQMHKYIWPEDVRTEEDTGVDFTKRSLGREEYLKRVRDMQVHPDLIVLPTIIKEQ